MIDLSLDQAILFRMLCSFFGKEQVIPKMSVMAVCGGELPPSYGQFLSSRVAEGVEAPDGYAWAKRSQCLFTIVDGEDTPKLVIELEASPVSDAVEVSRLEKTQFLQPLLKYAGIPYLEIRYEEFQEMTRIDGQLDIVAYLEARFEENEDVSSEDPSES